MGKGGGKRGLLSKLAFGLLIICFFVAGTNIVLISSMELQTPGSQKNEPRKNNNQSAKPNPKTAEAKHHDLANVVEKQREQAIESTNKAPSNSQDSSSNLKSRNNAIYKCSYGAANENRTSVVVPNNEPSFIIIGVQKSGSTSLLSHFRDHPQVLQTKKGLRREAHFFDTAWQHQVEDGWKRHGLKGANDKHCFALQEYMKLFETETILAHSQTMDHDDGSSSNSTHHLPMFTFEKTPAYFMDNKIPARIKQTVPWSKLILILRDPVDRAYSQYKMIVKTNHALRKYSLEDFIFHELKMMKDYKLTTSPLLVPVDVKEGNNETDPSIPTIADHYEFPKVPLDHANMDPTKWKRKLKALRLKHDKGPIGSQIILRRGLYNIQLKWWLQHYTANHDLLVIDYAELADNIQAVFEKVARFSGIPIPYAPGQDPSEVGIRFEKKVRADDRRHDLPMKDETRKFLTEFYAPYTAELEELLGPEWSAPKLGWNEAVLSTKQ